ncbi:MAG: DUF512 domain-containing protein [Lachnospiraceae bacterium]|nr:DUF512 domain-containing protein [Lachnospiraceae bacterium]
MKHEKYHIVRSVKSGSIAEEMEIEKGDRVISINGQLIEDIFDYQYLTEDNHISVLIKKPDGEEWELDIDKDEDEDLGIEFENGLMDDYRSCSNKCIFCFIDQMPPGMRETLYFKDDDSRLSFLQGNYVTLTNMSDHDIDRIIKYRLDPINISFQTTNPELRCKMLHNRFAGEALKKADRLFEAGIRMNGQIVLCKGINDGEELERSIRDLTKYIPYLKSVSVVPVGLSKYREGLYPLESFEPDDAREVLDIIHRWQEKLYEKHGTHFIHAGDEFYVLAGEEVPPEENYDGYLQYENGVGMIRSFLDEAEEAFRSMDEEPEKWPERGKSSDISLAGGLLMDPVREKLLKRLADFYPKVRVRNYPVRNDFFGEQITVSGLLTGQDIVAQLKGKELGTKLFLPGNLLRAGTDVLLDDMTLEGISDALHVPVEIIATDGYEFIRKLVEGFHLDSSRLVSRLGPR